MVPGDDVDEWTLPPRVDVWDDLFPIVPHLKPPGSQEMLRLIAYDIVEPKRWRRIHETCQDYGVSVQFSLFECWLEENSFQSLWAALEKVIDPKVDRLVAYTLDAADARKRLAAGQSMMLSQRIETYVV